MTGKALLLDALRGKSTPRPAWLPFVGVHGAHLVGKSATEQLKSADVILDGLLKARELYRPDGLPVTFDLQIEAEALGCDLHWSDDGPPAVVGHPLEDSDLTEFPELDFSKGRLPIVSDATAKAVEAFGKEIAVYGLITGPLTLALHLYGNELFFLMLEDEEAMDRLMGFCSMVGRQMAGLYLGQGADVIAVVDPMTSQISPDAFERWVTPYLDPIFEDVRARGGLSSLFVCGNATRNLPSMVRTKCDNVSVDENIDLAGFKALADEAGKSIGGNLKLTATLLLGDEDSCKRDALSCMEVGGESGFVLAPGCDLPYATPSDNLAAVAELVHDEYKRDVAKRTLGAGDSDDFADVLAPPMDDPKTTYVDVVTLNSATCAPCQYMVLAAQQAQARLGFPIEVREHKINTREGIGVMQRLGVSQIPTICIDGKPSFESIMPSPNELDARLSEVRKS